MTSTETARRNSPEFIIPGANDRTTVIGKTGTGKTVFGAWLLSKQRFDMRPWICIDFKDEELWDMVGTPPMQELKLGKMPAKRGLYRMRVSPGDEDRLEDWFWKVWGAENIGLFVDEVSLVPQRNAFKAILRQGRSKRIPVISCTQRPVDCDREIFTESQYMAIFKMNDIRDYKTIQGFTDNAPINVPLREHWSYWYNGKNSTCLTLKPVPPPATIAASLRDVAPVKWYLA